MRERGDAVAASGRGLAAEFRTPRSIGLLLLALGLAALFAGLAQWQLGRAVQEGTTARSTDETVLPLTRVARPQAQQTDASVGQLVTVSARFVAGDWLVASDRLNRGVQGYWVVGHAVTAGGAQLAVGVGWSATRAQADAAAERLRADPPASAELLGRYIDSDAAAVPASGSPRDVTVVSAAQLVNLWAGDTGGPAYEGVLTLRQPLGGLTAIYSPKPVPERTLNLLNIVYAAEWTLFALIAFYVWFRLVKDRWEQRRAEDAAAALPEPVDAQG